MPASRVRTSRHCNPRSPMRARASSRRLPFSTPLVTRGMGISRCRVGRRGQQPSIQHAWEQESSGSCAGDGKQAHFRPTAAGAGCAQRAAGVQARGDTAREAGWPGCTVQHAAGVQAASRQAIAGSGVPSACAACSKAAGSSAVWFCRLDTMSRLQMCRLQPGCMLRLAKLRNPRRLSCDLVVCLLPYIPQALPLTAARNPGSLPRADLNAVDPDPGRHQGQDARDQVHQQGGVIVAVQALLPELVQPCATDDQGRVDLQAGRAWLNSG